MGVVTSPGGSSIGPSTAGACRDLNAGKTFLPPTVKQWFGGGIPQLFFRYSMSTLCLTPSEGDVSGGSLVTERNRFQERHSSDALKCLNTNEPINRCDANYNSQVYSGKLYASFRGLISCNVQECPNYLYRVFWKYLTVPFTDSRLMAGMWRLQGGA